MNDGKNIIALHSGEFYQIRALSDELMSLLCQAKAMLHPIEEDAFFEHHDKRTLKHYFFALETIIISALSVKDKINCVVRQWEISRNGESL